MYGINIRHAGNGGEMFLEDIGYWLDGYDDINNVVYEFYESGGHHFYGGKLKERDLIREEEIKKHLNCKLIRIVGNGEIVEV